MIKARHRRRLSDRRRGESGLTLIELLLSLALLALLASFVAGGLVLGRRAFLLDRSADRSLEADAAIETLSDLLASALPLKAEPKGNAGGVVYDGQRQDVSFIGLGTGHAMRGGLQLITIGVEGGELVADVTPTQGVAKDTAQDGARHVVLLTNVRRVQFGFFGSLDNKAPRAWRNDWSKAEALPLQISCALVFEDDRRPPPVLVVTLHQRE